MWILGDGKGVNSKWVSDKSQNARIEGYNYDIQMNFKILCFTCKVRG